MPNVTVGHDYFRGELRSYRRWHEAFVRELVQNAVDAGATRISIDVDPDTGTVVAADNGSGMSARTLTDVFFEVGRSTKSAGDGTAIGGFGRARVILCFAQQSYQIRTGRLLVAGRGGTYEVTEVDGPPVQGCTFTISLLDGAADQIRREARRLLSHCDVDAHVLLDGTSVSGTGTPARARRLLRDADGRPWARVYLVPDAGGYLRVRVRGVQMFDQPLAGWDDVVVELEPGRSRDVLVGSREALTAPFGDQLATFVQDLASRRSQALRETIRPLALHTPAGGLLTLHATSQDPTDDTPRSPGGDAGGARPAEQAMSEAQAERPAASDVLASVSAKVASRTSLGTAVAPPVHTRSTPTAVGHDTFMFAEDTDPRVSLLARRWDPARFAATSRRRKLLAAWTEAVSVAVEVLLDLRPDLGSVAFGTGWVFTAETEAMCRPVHGGHALLLNPVGSGTASTFRLDRPADRWRLLTLALHEVAHIPTSGHDEAFAVLMTDMVAATDPVAAMRRVAAASRAT